MLSRAIGSGVGTLFGIGAYHFGNFTHEVLSHYDKIDQIPNDTAKTVITTAATASGILIGLRDYYNSRLARLHGD